MPLFDFLCLDCGATSELLLVRTTDQPACGSCGSEKVKKLLAPHAAYSPSSSPCASAGGDQACCGSSPDAAGCGGPGSCCGHH